MQPSAIILQAELGSGVSQSDNPAPPPTPPKRCAAGMPQLATIVKRSIENELDAGLYAPCRRAACERTQVFVPERSRNVAVFQFKAVEYFPVVARGSGRHKTEVGICLAILAGHFFKFWQALYSAKAAFQHRRVLRPGGGACARGAIIFFHLTRYARNVPSS